MFDRLIASDATGAEFKPRRSYFLVSSAVVGIMFLSAVVYSIFASDFGLGTSSFELAELLPVVDMAKAENEPPKPQPQTQSRSTSQVATRQVLMQDVSQSLIVPKEVSTVQNKYQVMPSRGPVVLSGVDYTPSGTSGRETNDTGHGPGSNGLSDSGPVAETVKETVPPPPVKAPPVKPPPTQSLGVINGKAASLVKPAYPAAARAVNAQGTVEVQVLLDETGRVVSAHAVNGNALLRPAAEVAARESRFTPTLLSHVPVKVTGIIVYNFVR